MRSIKLASACARYGRDPVRLLRRWVNHGYSYQEMARRLSVDRNTVRGWCRGLGVTSSTTAYASRRSRAWVVAERRYDQDIRALLWRWRIRDQFSCAAIGRWCGVTKGTVKNWCQRFGFPTDPVPFVPPRRAAIDRRLEATGGSVETRLKDAWGLYAPEVAKRLGVSVRTVLRWRHRYGQCACRGKPHKPWVWGAHRPSPRRA